MLRSKELLNDAERRWQLSALLAANQASSCCCWLKPSWQLVASNQRLFGSHLVLDAILPLIQQSCLVADRQQLCWRSLLTIQQKREPATNCKSLLLAKAEMQVVACSLAKQRSWLAEKLSSEAEPRARAALLATSEAHK